MITLPPGLRSLKTALQAAARLRPDAAETHLARAEYLYYGLRDYADALAELEIVREHYPTIRVSSNSLATFCGGAASREEGLQNMQRAMELDPRNFDILQQIAISYQQLGRYAEAIDAYGSRVSDRARRRRNAGRSRLILHVLEGGHEPAPPND